MTDVQEDILRLSEEWHDLISGDHHKDKDCHWYLFPLKASKLITIAAIIDNKIVVAKTISIRVNPLDLPVIIFW